MFSTMMCSPSTNPFVMNKTSSSSDISKNYSSWITTNHEIMLVDCCSFLGLGLGIDEDFLACENNRDDDERSTAYFIEDDENDEDDENRDSATLEDTLMGDESLTLTLDTLDTLVDTLDTPDNGKKDNGNGNYELNIDKKEEDTKTTNSTCSISVLLMENIVEDETAAQQDDEYDEESKTLFLLMENTVKAEMAVQEDDEESKTLNTRSTMKLPPSLDTKTWGLPPSLDTETWDLPLPGQEVVETRGDKAETGTRRNNSNPSSLQPHSNDNMIDRVPSLVDIGDDLSIISSMSVEVGIFLNDGDDNVVGQKSRAKRFAGGEEMILKSPSNKKTKKHNVAKGKEQRGNDSFESASSRTTYTEVQPTLSAEASKATIPISFTKSADITATTICTDDDYYYEDNVPFDEPHSDLVAFSPSGHACSRLMPIEEIHIVQ